MTFKKFAENWKKLFENSSYRFSIFLSLVIWAGGYVLYGYAIQYVDSLRDAGTVGDLLFEFLPIVDLRFVYVYGIIIGMLAALFYVLWRRPDLLPFGLKFFAAVFIVRSIFITLTHLGPPEGFFIAAFAADYSAWPFGHMMHSNDLFFSGHVAYPFMVALLLKENRRMFYFFLGVSALMAVTVLLMRIHYSIDVFAAYFIVYGLYHAVMKMFGKTDFAFKKFLTGSSVSKTH